MYRRPRLVRRCPLPDLADPALRRVLTGHTYGVWAVAVAPNGSWLATGGYDQTVRIWDPATGQALALMRLDDEVHAAACLGASTLVVGGPSGLYLFDFLIGTSPYRCQALTATPRAQPQPQRPQDMSPRKNERFDSRSSTINSI